MTGIGRPVKPPACFWPAAVLDPDSLGVAAEVASEWLVLCSLVGRCSRSVRGVVQNPCFLRYTDRSDSSCAFRRRSRTFFNFPRQRQLASKIGHMSDHL